MLDGQSATTGDGTRLLELVQGGDRRVDDIDRVRRAERLAQHVVDAGAVEHRTHRAAGHDAGSRRGGTQQDDAWLALYAVPGYPDHPSGYNCFTAGTFYAARLFFGTDKVSFSLTSPGTAPLTNLRRDYRRFTDVIDDTIDGRILTGFHFRFADVQGAWIGKKVAQYL